MSSSVELETTKCTSSITSTEPLSPDKIRLEADRIFQSLLTEAINTPGDHGVPHKQIDHELNQEVLQEGRRFFHRNYAAVIITVVLTEFLQFPIRRITAFVLRRDEYNRPGFGYLRGISTMVHISKWFGPDFGNKEAVSAQDAYMVRRIHQKYLEKLPHVPPPPANNPKKDRLHILEAIRKDLAHIGTPEYLPEIMTETPSTPMSQFDMVIVLGVFYFLLDVAPTRVGLYTTTANGNGGYESYIQYIGLLGKYLGIEDRFNLPLISNAGIRKEVSRRIWEEIMTPCFKHFNENEFLNLSYFSEHALIINPFALVMHALIKDVLGAGQAKHTKMEINLFYRIVYAFLPLGQFLMRFRLVVVLANFGMKLWYWGTLLITRRKLREMSHEKDKHGGGCPV